MRRWARRVALLARYDLTDLMRERGTWISLLMFPIVNVMLIVLLPGFLEQRELSEQESRTYDVAVEGSISDLRVMAPRLLTPGKFDVVQVTDAETEVRKGRAHVGIVIRAGAADAFTDAGEEQAQVTVVALSSRRVSNLGTAEVVKVLDDARQQRAEARAAAVGLQPRVVRPVTTESVDLAATNAGARLQLSQAIPLLMLLPLTSAVGIAAQRVAGSKDLRIMEPLLLLPVARSTVLAGKALAGVVLGVILLPAVILPLAIARFLPAGRAGRPVEIPPVTILSMFAVAGVLLVLLVALGAFTGAMARSNTELAVALPFATFPIILLGMSLQFVSSLHATALFAAVPILGPVLLARDVVADVAVPSGAAITVVSTVAWCAMLLAGASRFLERERAVIRVTR